MPGIVHQEIGCLAEGLEGGCDLFRGGNVSLDAHRVVYLGCGLSDALGAQVEDADAIAGLAQATRDVGPQSSGSACNHCRSHVDLTAYAFS
jgi:hypothetical protein